MKYLTTNVAFQAQFSMVSGYVPVIKSVFNNEVYKTEFLEKGDTGAGIAAASVKVCVEQADNYFYSPAFVGSSEARDQVGSIMSAAMAQASKSEGLSDAQLDQIFKNAVDECEYYAS